jgi:hypothetical protein
MNPSPMVAGMSRASLLAGHGMPGIGSMIIACTLHVSISATKNRPLANVDGYVRSHKRKRRESSVHSSDDATVGQGAGDAGKKRAKADAGHSTGLVRRKKGVQRKPSDGEDPDDGEVKGSSRRGWGMVEGAVSCHLHLPKIHMIR